MSAAMVIPYIWAIGAELPVLFAPSIEQPQPQMSFYRRYTEAVLRRYVKMSMEAGKVPSLLGQEMFRGNVTNYRVGNFDDVVIFLHDIDRCLEKLDEDEQQLIARLSLQQYTVGETAEILRMKPRTVIRRYGEALDRLTKVLLTAKMLEAANSCQGGLL
ncbi:MAG TPA: sigma factor-like helix-turn-helix DNA-binding protein [Acidobacteriaceae bacterium]|nr:sigma factor-like helix-turn-helix DNA-binding protein [Acidobacteriaceae bacterium]